MRIVVPGGSGHVGQMLRRHFKKNGATVVTIGRSRDADVLWDGKTLGPWTQCLESADVVINLAGRTVDCRYTEKNLSDMMTSRTDSTRVLGEALRAARTPPPVWLQMSTATIYAHRTDAPNDERSGQIGGSEPGVPAYWKRSIDIAKAWEETAISAKTPRTRQVLLRSAMVMSPDRGSVFDVLSKMARVGLGGTIAGGEQYVSWIHGDDFAQALELLIKNKDIEGAINLSSPTPLPQKEFMRVLRDVWKVPVGLPVTRLMAEVGAWLLRTDTELILKSRRVVPTKLLELGMHFEFPEWTLAAAHLVKAQKYEANTRR